MNTLNEVEFSDYGKAIYLELKGLGHQLDVYSPIALLPHKPVRYIFQAANLFVDREIEFNQLLDHFKKWENDQGQAFVVISGSSGYGKSALGAELKNFIQKKPRLIMW